MQRAPTRTTREQQPSGVGMTENGAVQNELTLRHVVDGISALVAVLTPDGAVEIVNRQVLNYFSKTLEELREWSGTDAVHPDDLPTVIALWTRSIESGEPYDIELRQRARMASTEGSMRRVCLCGMQKAASFVGSSCKRMSTSESVRNACSPERISFSR